VPIEPRSAQLYVTDSGHPIVLQAYDQHLNMILGEVEETLTTVEIDDETYEEIIKASAAPQDVSVFCSLQATWVPLAASYCCWCLPLISPHCLADAKASHPLPFRPR
jgi:hypothetical protein